MCRRLPLLVLSPLSRAVASSRLLHVRRRPLRRHRLLLIRDLVLPLRRHLLPTATRHPFIRPLLLVSLLRTLFTPGRHPRSFRALAFGLSPPPSALERQRRR